VTAPTSNVPRETPQAVELLTAGSSFARYEVVRCIGVGGMGAVFEATHALLRKRVAIKTLHASLGRSEASRARFLREAETVARIRHPNVVDISDVGVEQGIAYLVMEFLEGEDLASLLAREGRLAPTRAVDLLLPALAGLCAVHRLGIVHRDLKPENIFLATDSLGHVVPKVVDFGVSKDVEAVSADGLPTRHTVAGTPYYMAPEQARGSAVLDGRADQYAIGVVLYQCLTLVRPFDSESLLELIHLIDAGQYLPLQVRCPELPPELCAVVARAMARRADDRFPSTEAFGQALSSFASESVAAACAREFAVERRSALPQRGLLADAEQRSAPTLAEAPLPAALPSSLRRSASGVRARSSATPELVVTAAPRRAFWLAALVTFVLLAGAGAYLWQAFPPPQQVTREPSETAPSVPTALPAAAPVVAPPAPAPAEPTPAVAPAAEAGKPAEAQPQRSVRSKRAPKPAEPAAPPVDIQLSR
jgi:serine/threonine protein kinase